MYTVEKPTLYLHSGLGQAELGDGERLLWGGGGRGGRVLHIQRS